MEVIDASGDCGEALASALRMLGAVQLRLPNWRQEVHAESFRVARPALEDAAAGTGPHRLAPGADSADATGTHPAGALSRYNASRAGLIFSNGEVFDVDTPGVPAGGFSRQMEAFFEAQCSLAEQVLRGLEASLGVQRGWFASAMGDLRRHSQWHIKCFVGAAADSSHRRMQDGRVVLLPMHTDPSIISLVVHDREGMHPGAMGLEVWRSEDRAWLEAPWCGHGVATLFVGSVLERISGGSLRAARHRVVSASGDAAGASPRVAATFFFRPAPEAVLSPDHPIARRSAHEPLCAGDHLGGVEAAHRLPLRGGAPSEGRARCRPRPRPGGSQGAVWRPRLYGRRGDAKVVSQRRSEDGQFFFATGLLCGCRLLWL
ncbi:unnamed protein product [Prorocentrum cordatum]|uniref:Isopenicillin N synthase-like Fe(2+) 2OG dioxygenase domain-containing protein n=1 Tax=Prorocentrum cordatum TaxID=2364126 RepID=A0ABN9TLF9_9DINO|nr:unnamed protein product [Polarella glacialis]